MNGRPQQVRLTAPYKRLADLTRQHFREAEVYMEEIGFTGIGSHKMIHEKLVNKTWISITRLLRVARR